MIKKLVALTLLSTAIGFLFWNFTPYPFRKIAPRAIKGLLDLSNWDFKIDGPAILDGEYEFYWKQHLTPEDFNRTDSPSKTSFIEVHGSWNGHEVDGETISGLGYATYRLTILTKETLPLALKFLDMATAFQVFANGEKILSVGKEGVTGKGRAVTKTGGGRPARWWRGSRLE